MALLIDISGKKFGRIMVTNRIPGLFGNHVKWNCECECGRSFIASSQNIRTGHTQSCGCRQKDIMRKIRTKHGMTSRRIWEPSYRLWASAKLRASKKGLAFSIQPTDIIIPDKCPLLEIPIRPNTGTLCDTSPTLDRVDGALGYTKDNIWVVSYKANRSKNNLTISEMKMLLKNLEAKRTPQ